MYARVITVQSQPGNAEESVRIYRDSLVPAFKQQQGFKGTLLLTDPNTHKGIAISLWETEADMRTSEASGFYQEQMAKFAHIFAGPPTREVYEVNVQV